MKSVGLLDIMIKLVNTRHAVVCRVDGVADIPAQVNRTQAADPRDKIYSFLSKQSEPLYLDISPKILHVSHKRAHRSNLDISLKHLPCLARKLSAPRRPILVPGETAINDNMAVYKTYEQSKNPLCQQRARATWLSHKTEIPEMTCLCLLRQLQHQQWCVGATSSKKVWLGVVGNFTDASTQHL